MTPKQQRFVEEYLIDCNATQAAIRAGYSEKTARVIACQNLIKPDIAEAVAAGRAKLSDKAGIDAEWVVRRLKMEAELSGEGASHSARVSALSLAAKIAGMVTDKVDMKQAGELTIIKRIIRASDDRHTPDAG